MNPETEVIYKMMYPGVFERKGINQHITGRTVREMRFIEGESEIGPQEVDLSSKIGPVTLNFPLLSAAMDAVTGPHLAKALFEVGGCGIIYRHLKAEVQLKWIEEVLNFKPCLVSEPKSLLPDQTIEAANDIHQRFGFDTIPVVKEDDILLGILFFRDIAVDEHRSDSVSKWMKPFNELTTERAKTSFAEIKDRLNQERISLLPAVGVRRKLEGLYFKKDFFYADPSFFKQKPLVGMAIGVEEGDLERVKAALDMGIGMIVIDSSHGNCSPVINQAKRLVKLVNRQAAVIAGNVAGIDGYLNLAETGVDAVKFGIGPGSICTTSQGTGAGFPMFTLIEEASFARKYLIDNGKHAPKLIPDGSISGPGDMVVALAIGGDACMAGEWLVAAEESLSCQEEKIQERGGGEYVKYWGMASKKAIARRVAAERYGSTKRAPEGIEKLVSFRGPLKKWLGEDKELVRGGFSHTGSRDIKSLHEFARHPLAFRGFTVAGQNQI